MKADGAQPGGSGRGWVSMHKRGGQDVYIQETLPVHLGVRQLAHSKTGLRPHLPAASPGNAAVSWRLSSPSCRGWGRAWQFHHLDLRFPGVLVVCSGGACRWGGVRLASGLVPVCRACVRRSRSRAWLLACRGRWTGDRRIDVTMVVLPMTGAGGRGATGRVQPPAAPSSHGHHSLLEARAEALASQY